MDRLRWLALLGGMLPATLAWGQVDPRTFGGGTSQVLHNMTFGTDSATSAGGGSSCSAPVVPGGCNTQPNCNVVIAPGWGFGGRAWNSWGWGAGYSGWGYNDGQNVGFQQGYYQGALDRENQLLRQELLRRQWQLDQEAMRRNAPPEDNDRPLQLPVGPRTTQRERAERLRAESSLKSGMRHFQRGSYLQAAQRFEQARHLPNASAMFLAGQAYIAAGQFDRAVEAIKAGLDQNPDWPTAEVDLGDLYPNRDDLAAQMGLLARKLKDNPKDADLMFLLGFELFGAGERDQARTLLDQAARLSADDRHIKPFFDFYASLDELNSPPDANQPASSDKDVPIPDLLGEQPATRPKRS